jgi:hypothetical protein
MAIALWLRTANVATMEIGTEVRFCITADLFLVKFKHHALVSDVE